MPSAIAEDLVGAQGRTGAHGKKFLPQGKYVYTAETRNPRLGKSTVWCTANKLTWDAGGLVLKTELAAWL